MEELNDENNIEICIIKVKDNLYEIAVNESEEMLYLLEIYTKKEDSKESLTFSKMLWYHNLILDYDIKEDIPAFGILIPVDEIINIVDYFRLNV